MHTTWSTERLSDFIRSTDTEVETRLAILQSLTRYLQIFRYHLFRARDEMRAAVPSDDPNLIEATSRAFGVSEAQGRFEEARLASEADTIACIHSARALWDVFAFLTNRLVLSTSLADRSCTLKLVIEALPASPLRSELERLISTNWYSYVEAFVNVAKHRYLIGRPFEVHFEDAAARFKFQAFEYGGKKYAECTGEDVLRGLVGVVNRLVDAGQLLEWEVVGPP